MAVIQTAVLLMDIPPASSSTFRGDVGCYHNYFFGPFSSVLAQTVGQRTGLHR